MFQANCHCDDCRRSGGGVYASLAFVDASALAISGKTHTHQHLSDAGNTITKHFCPSCGSQVYTENTKAPSRRGVRVGLIEDASWFEPKANVYASHRLPSTPIDPKIKAFDKMPG
jgi:hypothetical protein